MKLNDAKPQPFQAHITHSDLIQRSIVFSSWPAFQHVLVNRVPVILINTASNLAPHSIGKNYTVSAAARSLWTLLLYASLIFIENLQGQLAASLASRGAP